MDLRGKRQDILRVAARHGARNIRVFGSAARGEDRPGSDIDLLVETGRERYSPARFVSVAKDAVTGMPDLDRASTSHVERKNADTLNFFAHAAELFLSRLPQSLILPPRCRLFHGTALAAR